MSTNIKKQEDLESIQEELSEKEEQERKKAKKINPTQQNVIKKPQ